MNETALVAFETRKCDARVRPVSERLDPLPGRNVSVRLWIYTYNRLQSATGDGGRYAALRTYRCKSGATDLTKVQLAVKNMVVYGTPAPTGDSVPVVNGLTTGNVNVQFNLTSGVPTSVTVDISSFTIDTVFTSYTLTGKPVVKFPYIGRYAPEESEP